jgi:tetratricopeptide (TPR) repeat protein
MIFCGRANELSDLISRWKIVSDIESPAPQLVILKAERGVGKTRLALEFYRWLSENVDAKGPDSYWPDNVDVMSRGFDVNANPYDCRYNQTMPFLWWGIRAVDPGAENPISGDAIASYDRYLAPHLVALAMKSRSIRGGKALLGVWAEVAKSEAASWSGYDTVLSVGEGIFKSIQILRGTLEQTKGDATDEINKKSVNRVNVILDDLEMVLNPRSSEFAKTPAVILIDDAQFTPNDPGLADFCEKLMHKSMTQRWPLLILVTHWKRDLSPEFMKSDKSFAGILHHARDSSRPQQGPVAGLPGGYLNDLDTFEIDLAPISELSGALKEALPGLLAEQSEALLHHAGGNPRHLEQIIAFLKENENFFNDHDTANALTEHGLQEALEETQDIFKVVMRRLRDAPPDVQEAICLASLQGTRFVSDIVNDLAKVVLSGDRLEALRQAINPFSMVSGREAASISEFSERLFYLVAEKRRQSLKQFKDTDAVYAALREILRERVNSIDIHAVEDVEGVLMTLGLSAQVFAESDPSLVLNSLGMACQLEQRRYSYAAAVELADRYFELLSNTPSFDGIFNLSATVAVTDVLLSEGRTNDAWGLRLYLLGQIRVSVEQNNSPENLRTLTILLDKVGDAARSAGNVAGAAKAWEESLSIRRNLTARLQTSDSQRELMTSLNRRGDAFMDTGDVQAATQAYEEALSIARDLAAGLQTPASRGDLLFALTKIGTAAMAAGNISTAAQAGQEGLKIARNLAGSLKTIQSQSDLLVLLNMVGEVLSESGYQTAAAQLWHEGLGIARDLADRLQTPHSQHDLWVSLNKVGEAAMNLGDVTAAAQAWADGLAIARDLYERLQTPQSLRAVWASLCNVGDAAMAAGDVTAAAQAVQESLDIARYLAMRVETPQSHQDLLGALDRFGDVVMAQGDVTRAAKVRIEAVDIARNLAEQLQTAPSQENLSLMLVKHAKAEAAKGNQSGAALAAREAVNICRGLADHFRTTKTETVFIEAIGLLILYCGDQNEAKFLVTEGETLAGSLEEPERSAVLEGFAGIRTLLK